MSWLITRPGAWIGFVLFSQVVCAHPPLFFTESQREQIEQQRQVFLNQGKTQQAISSEPAALSGYLRVQAILNINGEPFVQLNDRLFRQREHKDGIHVHRIYQNRVTLTIQGQWGQARVGQTFELENWPQIKEPKVNVKN